LGKPTDHTFIESFNGRFRQEGLNTHWFLSLHDAKSEIEALRRGYNAPRLHSLLGWTRALLSWLKKHSDCPQKH